MKIWREKKHKDPSCRLRNISQKEKDGKRRNTKYLLAGAEIHLKKRRWNEKNHLADDDVRLKMRFDSA